ncbi:MAG: acyltransferase family protein [Ruminococcus sp.]|nr:acyltransferase family protein [Ruminococcus sp.]
MIRQRNNTIDIFRLLASFLVVCLHTFPGNEVLWYDIINVFCRVAVPFFFLVSGYYFNTSNKNRSMKRILKISLISMLFYFVFSLCIGYINNDFSSIINAFSIKRILELIILNEPFFGGHLWFLFALLYCMAIDYFLSKKIKFINISLIIAPIIVFLVFAVGQTSYNFALWYTYIPFEFVRNFIFIGFPFFFFGKVIFLKHDYLLSINYNKIVIILFF